MILPWWMEPMLHLAMRLPALAVVSYHVGQLFTRLKLPQISGYLITGMLAGPYGTGIISEEALEFVRGPSDQACLACIALAAGCELHLGELRRTFAQVNAITWCITLATWTFVTPVLFLLADQIEFMRGMTTVERLMVGSVAGTVMVARSPAAAIAVLKEVDGRGPFCSLTLSVVVMKDVLVIVMFALNLAAVKFVEKGISTANGWSAELQILMAVLHPLFSVQLLTLLFIPGQPPGKAHSSWAMPPPLPTPGEGAQPTDGAIEAAEAAAAGGGGSVVASVGMGAGMGVLLIPTFRARLHKNVAAHEARLKTLCLFLLAVTCFAVTALLEWEPLLACVAMGLYAANSTRDPLRLKADREAVERALEVIMPTVNVAFFTMTGSSLKLGVLAAALPVAVVVFAVRLLSLYVGATAGCQLAGCPPDHTAVAWMAYVTQAGVALGLIKSVVMHEPKWGPPFSALMIAVVVLNSMVGPPMFRFAIMHTGEAHKGHVGAESKPVGAERSGPGALSSP